MRSPNKHDLLLNFDLSIMTIRIVTALWCQSIPSSMPSTACGFPLVEDRSEKTGGFLLQGWKPSLPWLGQSRQKIMECRSGNRRCLHQRFQQRPIPWKLTNMQKLIVSNRIWKQRTRPVSSNYRTKPRRKVAQMCAISMRIDQSEGDWPHLAPYRVWGQYGGQPARGEW